MPWQRSTTSPTDDVATSGDRLPSAVVAALVARAKLGDSDAFGDLYDHYVGQIYAFVAVRISNREAAEDATQTIFVRALHSIATCRQDAGFAGWLFAIARNTVTDIYRADRLHPGALYEAADPEDPALTPEDVAIQQDDARLLREARQRCLSPKERELFDLLVTEMNDKEIGQALGRSHGAVRVAHHRLMTKLRECLEKLFAFGGVRRDDV